MKITIDINDEQAPEILQNYAASQRWVGLSDEEIAVKVAQFCETQLIAGAVQGSSIKAKNDSDAALTIQYDEAIASTIN